MPVFGSQISTALLAPMTSALSQTSEPPVITTLPSGSSVLEFHLRIAVIASADSTTGRGPLKSTTLQYWSLPHCNARPGATRVLLEWVSG